MNEELHWDDIASEYTDEVLNVYRADKNRILQKYISKHTDQSKTAIDFGCGIGNGFPYLSPAFKKVLAIDISAECLEIARQRSFINISFKKADLTSSRLKLHLADFGTCINVLLLPLVDENRKILRNIFKSLKPNASAVFVLPAMESILHTGWTMIEWYKKEGTPVKDIPRHEFSAYKASKPDLLQGIIDIRGVPTKHYLQTEIEVLFGETEFNITAIDKVEYNWETEFDQPPKWMKAPYPWDWLVECKASP